MCVEHPNFSVDSQLYPDLFTRDGLLTETLEPGPWSVSGKRRLVSLVAKDSLESRVKPSDKGPKCGKECKMGRGRHGGHENHIKL